MKKKTVPAFSIDYHKKVNVLISPIKIESLDKQSSIDSQAIWDTGATNSVITKSIVAKLNLKPISKKNVKGVHSTQSSNVYLANIILLNKVRFENVQLTECDELVGNDVEVLIGMDIINFGDLCISNYNGATHMSFRVPSIEKTDYVKLQNQKFSQSIGKQLRMNSASRTQQKKKGKR